MIDKVEKVCVRRESPTLQQPGTLLNPYSVASASAHVSEPVCASTEKNLTSKHDVAHMAEVLNKIVSRLDDFKCHLTTNESNVATDSSREHCFTAPRQRNVCFYHR